MSIQPDSASTGRRWAGADDADPASPITLPSNDPFYRTPVDLEDVEPGTVVRSRAVDLALFGVIRQKVSAWQLLYRTTSLDGVARVAVTTVVLPVGGRKRTQRALLSYQCAIDAVSDRCFPSYALRAGARAVGSVPQFEFLIILYALRRGWVLSLPDHEGMDGQWGAPIEPGYCVLDGVRAAQSFEPLDLTAAAPVALWGYSGGGLATSWAAEAAADYAPELDIVGAALGSPVGDPGSAFSRLNGTIFAALPAMVVEGLRRTYPVFDSVVREHVAVRGLETLSSLHRKTTVHDPMIDVGDVDGQVRRYRAAGANVTYFRDRLSEHLSLHPIAAPLTLDWLSDRCAGKPIDGSTTRTVWSLAGSLAGLRGLIGLTVSTGRAFGGRVG
jgi:pimeloyl-ACP methyl ester carboxylesterase